MDYTGYYIGATVLVVWSLLGVWWSVSGRRHGDWLFGLPVMILLITLMIMYPTE